jgi:tetratricopeptide (TPR) repeat protein
MGNALRARTVLQDLLQRAPKNAEVRALLGQSEEIHAPETAIAHYKAAIEIQSDYLDPYLRLAKLFLRLEKQTDAFATLEQAATAAPKSVQVRTALGEAYLETDQLDPAQKTLEEALALQPSFNAALFNLGRVFERRGESALALQRYRELQQRDRTFPGLAQRIGELHLAAKNFEAAAEAYEQALAVDDPPKALRLAAARALVLAGAHQKALEQCSAVLAEHPNEAAAWAWRAAAHLAQSNEGDALVEIRQAIQREQHPDFHMIHGRVLAAVGRTAEAIDAMGRALKLDPGRLELRLKRARLLVRGGAVQDGLREVKAVLKVDPRLAEAHLYMGIALVDLRRRAPAMDAFEKTIALDPKMAEAHFRLGQLLADDQRLAAAHKHLKQAVEHGTEKDRWYAEALYHLGMAALRQNRRNQAISALRRFLEVAPATDAARAEVQQTLRRIGVELKPGGKP